MSIHVFDPFSSQSGTMLEDGRVVLPQLKALMLAEVSGEGLFVADNGRTLSIYIGEFLDPHIHAAVFEENPSEPSKVVFFFFVFTSLRHFYDPLGLIEYYIQIFQLALRPYNHDEPSSLASRINLIV
jgi:hypothetical protein